LVNEKSHAAARFQMLSPTLLGIRTQLRVQRYSNFRLVNQGLPQSVNSGLFASEKNHMRPFEITTVSLLMLAWGSRLLPVNKYPLWPLFLSGLALLAAILQLMVEPYRWQMIPTYALVVLLFVVSLAHLSGKSATSPTGLRSWILKILGIGLGFLVITVAIALLAVFPVFQFPNPTGPYKVGVTTYALIDASRPETFTPALEDKRQIYLQVWYPARASADLDHMPPYPANLTTQLAKAFSLPDFVFNHLGLVKGNSYLNAPLAESKTAFPVLVFSHGYYIGFTGQNTVQMEELASHGYIIFSIGHAYEALLVLDSQGQIVPAIPPATPSEAEFQKMQALIDQMKSTTGSEQNQAVRAFLDFDPAMQDSLQVWTQDTQFVLKQIELMNRGQMESPFTGRLDLAHIGMFGMSFGGATAFQVCAIDTRCQAALNMDGFQYGTLLDDRLQTPFLMMYSEVNDHLNDWALNNSPESGYSLRVKDTTHLNYTDFNLIAPILLGKIDSARMERIMNTYTLAFFDQTLKGVPSSLLQAAHPDYPEVELRIFSADPQ
jgi:predicted dienelactone hydrolase